MAETQDKSVVVVKSNKKRDDLLQLEAEVQAKWEKEKVFEVDAPENGKDLAEESYFVTFPFPYMNGKLHLGHTFTLLKAEFAVGYQRLKGKKCVWPFGFHCTGMPIKAAADKLARELEKYGNPPNFPKEEENKEVKVEQKAKVAAKSTGHTYQWQILEASEIPTDIIPQFADANFWLDYFPPFAMEDLKALGTKIDWRRSFITTPANPYFDSFVRWQFTILKEKDKIRFGKRYTIYSPKDGQACMDHDRSKGEGVQAQEYAGIKIKVLDPKPEKLAALGDKEVYLVAATLRPETMYGQTNCWVSPTITYVAFAINDKEVFVTTRRAARNMSYQVHDPVGNQGVQGYTRPEGDVDILTEISGMELMGCKLSAPLSKYEVVYALPLLTIKEDKGTGIVTCVPSDAPDDFAGLRDLKKKEALRKKFNITDEMVLPFDPVPIIDIPDYGDLCAVKACDELGIQSQNDSAKLAEAKETCYQKGFYHGLMKVGNFAGKKVEDAKDLVRKELFDAGTAVLYKEPEKQVVSRSADECVVALCDQWYLVYGEPEWRAQAEKLLKNVRTYDALTLQAFEITLNWLHEHACSRSYGLGSRMPWDEQYLIESLSDSTIYMAYYTVAHLLHGGSLTGNEGAKSSPIGIGPEDMTREVWDYIFLGKACSDSCPVPKAKLDKLRNEFNYFYPMDLRVSGKDLIQNHLTYALYNHVAIFPEEMWPRAIRTNGHLNLNDRKMSKSEGNFLTLKQGVERFSADATRFTLADAGDSLENANFEFIVANAVILTLFKELEWTQETLKTLDSFRTGDMDTFPDKAFMAAINHAITVTDVHYENMMYREARKTAFSELQSARDSYREICGATNTPMHRDLIAHFITVQWLLMAPITPHISEKIWSLLGHETSIMHAKWPKAGPIDTIVQKAYKYLLSCVHTLRIRLQKQMTLKNKKGKGNAEPPAPPTKAVIYVAATYPEWQQKVLSVLDSKFDEATNSLPDQRSLIPDLKVVPELSDKKFFNKNVMPFVSMIREGITSKGREALAQVLPFDELATLKENIGYITKSLKLEDVSVAPTTECSDEKILSKAAPGEPVAVFI